MKELKRNGGGMKEETVWEFRRKSIGR